MKPNPVCFIKEYLTAFQFTMKDGTTHIGYGLSSVDAFLTINLPESERENVVEWTQLDGVEIPDEACLKPTVITIEDEEDIEIDLSDLEDEEEDTEVDEEEIEIEMDVT